MTNKVETSPDAPARVAGKRSDGTGDGFLPATSSEKYLSETDAERHLALPEGYLNKARTLGIGPDCTDLGGFGFAYSTTDLQSWLKSLPIQKVHRPTPPLCLTGKVAMISRFDPMPDEEFVKLEVLLESNTFVDLCIPDGIAQGIWRRLDEARVEKRWVTEIPQWVSRPPQAT